MLVLAWVEGGRHLSMSPTTPCRAATLGPAPSLWCAPTVDGSAANPYALNVWYCSSNAKCDAGW